MTVNIDLAHPIVLYVVTYTGMGRFNLTALTWAVDTVANVCISFGLAFVLYLLVEKPSANLQGWFEKGIGMRS